MNYIHNHDDYAVEPRRGLPAALPPGEFVLWQGAPAWRVFARQVFHTRTIALLILAAAALRAGMTGTSTGAWGTAFGEAGVIILFGAGGLAILSLLAWLVERTTVYTITNKRIVMRVGVAIQKTFNIPFAQMESAALKRHGSGRASDHGSLSVSLKPGVSIAYLILWPHARPWKMGHTQPTLRAIPKASGVAQLLTDAFTSYVRTDEALKRSALSQAEADTAPQTLEQNDTSAAQDKRQDKPKDPHHIPSHLVMLSALAALLAIAVVIFAQITDHPGLRGDTAVAVFSEEIRFVPLPGDEISVISVATGDQITHVPEAADGLLRGALRGMGMTRSLSDFDLAAPYELRLVAEDGVYLSDPLTGRDVRLESFGPLETGATADLLRFAHSQGATLENTP